VALWTIRLGAHKGLFITVPVMPWVGALVGGKTRADSRRKSAQKQKKPAKPEPGGRKWVRFKCYR